MGGIPSGRTLWGKNGSEGAVLVVLGGVGRGLEEE